MTPDEEFLGLVASDRAGHSCFEVTPYLARFDHRLYGGAALGVSLTAMALTSGRTPLWATTQFISTVEVGGTIDCHTEVLAAGRRTSQLRVTATFEQEVIFSSLGSAVEPKENGLAGTFERMPTVSPPGTGKPAFAESGLEEGVGWHLAIESWEADIHAHPDPGPGRVCLWVRFREPAPWTPARLAFVADVIPTTVANACDVHGGGTSLDNTLRLGPMVPTEWVLMDLRAQLAFGGFGHGTVHLWSQDGRLLGFGSQSTSVLALRQDPLRHMPSRWG